MSEIQRLKERIEDSAYDGVETAIIRDDYEPAGEMMIANLVSNDEYVTRSVSDYGILGNKWKVFKAEFAPPI